MEFRHWLIVTVFISNFAIQVGENWLFKVRFWLIRLDFPCFIWIYRIVIFQTKYIKCHSILCCAVLNSFLFIYLFILWHMQQSFCYWCAHLCTICVIFIFNKFSVLYALTKFFCSSLRTLVTQHEGHSYICFSNLHVFTVVLKWEIKLDTSVEWI